VSDRLVSLRTEKVMLVDVNYIFEVQCACQLDNVITYLEEMIYEMYHNLNKPNK